MAKASMWLGIISLVLLVLAIVVSVAGVFGAPDFWEAIQDVDPENIDRLINDPDMQESAQSASLVFLSSTGCCFLGMLGALLGLIFGIVGISQEQDRPTRSGRTHSIVGIVLSVIPLLCCVATIVAYIVVLGGVLPSSG
jgi:ABC-type Fe3+ transport system permease subunit